MVLFPARNAVFSAIVFFKISCELEAVQYNIQNDYALMADEADGSLFQAKL